MYGNDAIKAIDEQIAMMEALYTQVEGTIAALKALKEKGEAIIPIAPDTFIPAKLAGEKVLVAVGGDVLLEKTIDEAIELLNKRKENVKANIEKLRALRRKVAERGSA
jgi:prefoldin alpha subunit